MDSNNQEQAHDSDDPKGFWGGGSIGILAGANLLFKLKYLTIPFIVAVLVIAWVGHAMTQSAPTLGTAESFAVLGGSTVTNTGPTIINGNLGVSPGLAVTGFPPGLVLPPGAIHAGDAVAQQAQNDVTITYNVLAGRPCNADLTGLDLGGLTLTPGVYCFDTSAQLTGKLTLDVEGDANAVFIFQIGSTLTTAPGATVVFVNGGPSCNVFWQVGSSATLDTATAFAGNIVALASITLVTGASVSGRVLARNGAVTMDSNNIARCFASPAATNTPLPPTQTAIAATETVIAPTLTAIALTPTPTLPPPTQTAIAATVTAIAPTQTAIAATETVIAATETVIAPTLTAIALTPTPTLPPPTQTAIAATVTAIALTPTPTLPPPTQTAIAATETVIAATQTVIAPTLTAIAMTPTATNTPAPLALDESDQPQLPIRVYLPLIIH